MPCNCNTNFDNSISYPSSRITIYDFQLSIANVLGLSVPTSKNNLLLTSKTEANKAREQFGIWRTIEENSAEVRRVFLFLSSPPQTQSTTEFYFVPTNSDDEGKNFVPKQFQDPTGGIAITDLQKCRQSIHTTAMRNDNLWINNEMKIGRMTINAEKFIDGVGGLRGLLTPWVSEEHANDIPKSLREAICDGLLCVEMANSFKSVPVTPRSTTATTVNGSLHRLALIDENRDVLDCVFEFIDTLTLVNTVASVCPLFHKLIVYNQESGDQIFGGRMLNFCKANNLQQQIDHHSIQAMKKMHPGTSWLEFYLLSGMIFLENLNLEQVCTLISNHSNSDNNPFSYGGNEMRYLILDPTMLLTNRTISSLIENKRKKIIGIRSSFFQKVSHSIDFPSSPASLISSVLFAPLINCADQQHGKFHANFEQGIPLYVKYLKEMTCLFENHPILSTTDNHQLKCLQYASKKMVEKAQHFIEQSKQCYFNSVTDDVLLGLHFLLLDNYYGGDRKDIVMLDVYELLKNRSGGDGRKSNQKTCQFPNDLSIDFLSSLLSGNISIPIGTTDDYLARPLFKSSTNFFQARSRPSWEEKVREIQLFIKEHIIELSSVNYSNTSTTTILNDYETFLEDWENTKPSKEVDLYFHFHMLHSASFIQDSTDITCGSIKSHRLCFDDGKPKPALPVFSFGGGGFF